MSTALLGGEGLGIVMVDHDTRPSLLTAAVGRLAEAVPRARLVIVSSGHRAPRLDGGERPAQVEVVRVPNHSYSRAVNTGLRLLDEPYLALMNADVLVEQDTFTRLLTALRADPACGLVGPLALTPQGRPQDLGLPYRLAYRALARAGAGGVRVSWLSGCLQLLDRRLYEAIHGYDESLRFYNEDLEFCLRAKRAGFSCRLVPAPVVHVGGSSTPAHPAFHVEGRRGGYLLTERYRTPVEAFLHRGFLRAEALLGTLLARDQQGRAAHLAMAEMLSTGAWHSSPFGATLDDR